MDEHRPDCGSDPDGFEPGGRDGLLFPAADGTSHLAPSTLYKVFYPDADYFAVTQFMEENTFNDGQRMELTYWHRPLHAMTDAFTEAGFRVSVISEPPFSPDTPRQLLEPQFADRTAFLCFIFFVLEAS